MYNLKSKQKKKGFSLPEVIIVSALFAIIMVVVMGGVHTMYRQNAYTFAQAYQVQNARKGVTALVRDIREMTYADNGAFPLRVMDEHKIGFYSDIDRDDSVEYVSYELVASTTLYKYVYEATGTPATYDLNNPDTTSIVSAYVQNLIQGESTFQYYDASGTEVISADNLTDVRYVEVKSIVNIDPVRDPGQYMLRSSATLRNIRD
tara:strand:+ start:486 stop:1100 length:615 start_codon:yes stop_codon:yes gene_type:complete